MSLRLLVLTGMVLGLLVPVAQAAPADRPAPASTPAVQTVPGGLLLDWRPPAARLDTTPDGSVHITVDGYQNLEIPGLPEIPFSAALVALPDGARPVLELRQVDEREIALPGEASLGVYPAGVQRGPGGEAIGGAWVDAAAPAAVNAAPESAPRPSWADSPVVLEELGRLRGVRLARVVFFPARPVGNSLLLTRSIQVLLRYGDVGYVSAARGRLPAPFEQLLRPAVVNPEDLSAAVPPAAASTLTAQPAAGPRWAVEVSRVGLVALTYDGLQAAGLPVDSFIPQRLELSRAGSSVAAEWNGDGDDRFEPGEQLLFWAEPRFSRWTAGDVWYLSVADAEVSRMGPRTAGPTGPPAGVFRAQQVMEQNRLYTPDCFCGTIPAGRDGDRWVWDSLRLADRPAVNFSFNLPAVDAASQARLEIWLIGSTDLVAAPDHRITVALNGSSLGQIEWDGKRAHQAGFSFAGALLQSGENTLSLTLPGIPGVAIESAWIDAFQIQYTLTAGQMPVQQVVMGAEQPSVYQIPQPGEGANLYDVTEPDRPQRVIPEIGPVTWQFTDPAGAGGRRYWLSAGPPLSPDRLRPVIELAGGLERADYLILTPAAFLPAASELQAYRRTQGLDSAVVDVQEIYDAFSQGRPDPEGLRSYLKSAYNTWGRPPAYVLLLGDGTSDPRRYQASSPVTWIPPYLADVDPWAGETAADNRYVTVDGDDFLPDMLIGRLPVNSLEEASSIVAKIIRYETEAPAGGWRSTALFVADNADTAGDFPALSALAESAIWPSRLVSRLYLTPEGENTDSVRMGLIQHWNEGLELLIYTGHASIHQWAVENLIHLQEISALQNGLNLPVLLDMTCFTSAFHTPGFDTLDEGLLRHPNGGAAAVWGPTGLGLSAEHALLAEGFLSYLSGAEEGATVGEATLVGKIALIEGGPAGLNLLDTFVLLGDPAMRIVLARISGRLFLPAIQTSPDGG